MVLFERLHNGQAIIQPHRDWNREGICNSGGLFLPRSAENDAVIFPLIGEAFRNDPRIALGFFVLLHGGDAIETAQYRGQYKGLAVYTPEMELLWRGDEPVMAPSGDAKDIDCVGVEDARLTQDGETFYAWYCGYNGTEGAACAASSRDLIHWTKTAPLPGDINNTYNKDHAPFPEAIRGRYFMLHRPWGPGYEDVTQMLIRLSVSDTLLGSWRDLGVLMRPLPVLGREAMWLGGGAPPLPLGDGRYIMIYHNGSFDAKGYRQYDACAALLDFNRLNMDMSNVSDVVVSRIEPLLAPETPVERNADKRIDIIFPMAHYRYQDAFYLVYGAGDRCTCAARCDYHALLKELGA